MSPAGRLVVLAAGGTGGHMFPALALAAELERRGRSAVLVTDARGTRFEGSGGAVPLHRIAAGAPGGGLASAAKGAAALCRGWFQARRLLARLRPSIAVGFGGYASVPTILAAAQAGLPCALHEQNAVIGRANALLARRADVIATGFPTVSGLRPGDAARCVHTGNPVRPAVAALGGAVYVRSGTDTLLVIGGSQGARVLSDVVPAAVELLPAELAGRLRIVQQVRPEDADRVAERYRALSVPAQLRPFFVDLPQRMVSASLVVARAGASTIAELLTIGRPAILVPYPHAAAGHQHANADIVARAGAGWTMAEPDFSPAALAARMTALLGGGAALAEAARRALALSGPAAALLADRVERLGAGGGS